MRRKTVKEIGATFIKTYSRRLKEVRAYLIAVADGSLPRDQKGKQSLKYYTWALRDHAANEHYEMLITELLVLAINSGCPLSDMYETILEFGSVELNDAINSLPEQADTSKLKFLSLPEGVVAFTHGTDNLASIALAEADVYMASSERGGCIMTRRNWMFRPDYAPEGMKRVKPNLFVGLVKLTLPVMQEALRAVGRPRR